MKLRSLRLLSLFPLTIFLLVSGCGGGSDSDGGSLSNNACSVLGLNARIINGTECGEQSSPIVRLTVLNSDNSLGLCSGTLLTSTRVLTAAHCFFGNTIAASAEVNGSEVFINEVVLHPELAIDPNTQAVFNDLAIAYLAAPLPGATLPVLGSRSVSGGDTISIFGYGLDENQNTDVLRSGEMQVSNVTPNHVFAQFNGSGSNTCNGDSGGPAIFTFTNDVGTEIDAVIGVVSSGELIDCSAGDTTLFANTQTSSALNFIAANVPGLGIG